MSLRTISPREAKRLMDAGALLIDIREPHEYAQEHIPQAQLRPVASLAALGIDAQATQVIFHCRSGMRTQMNAARLAQSAACEAFVLEGGLDAWKQAGLPVSSGKAG